MVSVLEKVAGKRAGNYSTNPRIDVEVIENPARYCQCGGVVVPDGVASNGIQNWKHVEEPAKPHLLDRAGMCSFCGASEPGEVAYKQYSWYDAVECSRCGGVEGYAIGD